MTNPNTFKPLIINNNSNFRIVSMIPGDRKVAGCFNFSDDSGGMLNGINNYRLELLINTVLLSVEHFEFSRIYINIQTLGARGMEII